MSWFVDLVGGSLRAHERCTTLNCVESGRDRENLLVLNGWLNLTCSSSIPVRTVALHQVQVFQPSEATFTTIVPQGAG